MGNAECPEYRDELTRLPNRRRLSEVVETSSAAQAGLCLIDLDDTLKQINDTDGHEAGDRVLADVAERLRRVATDAGFELYRIRGDEFAALQLSTEDLDVQLEALALVFATAMQAPFPVGQRTRQIGVTIGVAIAAAGSATADALVASAYLERRERPLGDRRRPGDPTPAPRRPALLSLDDPDLDRAYPHTIETVRRWIGQRLAQPDPDLGRAGPVCPFIPAAMANNLITAELVVGATPDIDELCEQLRERPPVFQAAEPVEGAAALLKAHVVLFPDVTDYSIIDTVQRRLKPEFVGAGLMIGQFYPGCTEPGLWNKDFRPLDCPVPLIAIRQMVTNDFPFLADDPDWIGAYLRRFAPGVPSTVRRRLADRAGPG